MIKYVKLSLLKMCKYMRRRSDIVNKLQSLNIKRYKTDSFNLDNGIIEQ